MSWIDDLTVRIEEGADKLKDVDARLKEADGGSGIYAFLQSQARQLPIKIAPQLGNLSEEDLKKGLRGSTQPVASPTTPMSWLQNSLQASGISPEAQKYMMPLILILGALGIVAILKKSGRKRG